MRQILLNSGISIIALVLSFMALEVLVRYHFSHNLNYDFEMWKYAAELKEPLDDVLLPFHHKTDKSGNFYGVEIKTNSRGFRNIELVIPKPIGVKRVIMLGDSFTLGWGVSSNETFSKKLENMLNKKSKNFEVVNMGIGNYNTSMEVELFKRKGLALNPDILVLMYYINDTEITPNINGISFRFMKYFYLPAYVISKIRQLGMMSVSNDWLQAYYRRLYDPSSEGFEKGIDSINELIKITAEHKIKLLIVNIPDLRRLKNYPFDFATELPRELATKNEIAFLDLLPFFEKYNGTDLWVSTEDSHMNSLANSIAAQAICQKIVSQ